MYVCMYVCGYIVTQHYMELCKKLKEFPKIGKDLIKRKIPKL